MPTMRRKWYWLNGLRRNPYYTYLVILRAVTSDETLIERNAIRSGLSRTLCEF